MFTIDTGSPETQISIFVLLALGAMVGVLGGFFGVGGGWIVTPTLNILGMPMPFAVGTGLAYIMGMSFLSVLKHKASNAVEPALGISLGVTMMLGIQAGKSTVMALETAGNADVAIRTLYMLLLFSLGIFMFRDCVAGRKKRDNGQVAPGEARPALAQRFRLRPMLYFKRSDISVSFWPVAAIGVSIGFFSGLLGAGGGFLLVPAMFYLIGTPTIVAVGTSLLCLVIGSPFGVAVYALEGRVNLPAALIMLSGVVLAAPLGVRAAHAVKGAHLRFLYAAMILCGGLSVLLKELDYRFDSVLLSYSSKTLIFAAGGGIVLAIMLIWLKSSKRPPIR